MEILNSQKAVREVLDRVDAVNTIELIQEKQAQEGIKGSRRCRIAARILVKASRMKAPAKSNLAP
jgi:hypothetical protein